MGELTYLIPSPCLSATSSILVQSESVCPRLGPAHRRDGRGARANYPAHQ